MHDTTIDRSACTASEHGTSRTYQVNRCRCADALNDYRIYRKRLRENRVIPGRVNSVGTARRLRALAVIGWTAADLGSRLGVTANAVQHLRRLRTDLVFRTTVDRVAAVYDQLSATPGPSQRVRARALTEGWAAPILWEDVDIDDPAAEPAVDAPVTSIRRARVDLDEVDFLTSAGLSLEQAAMRMNVDPRSIQRARDRAAVAVRGEAA